LGNWKQPIVQKTLGDGVKHHFALILAVLVFGCANSPRAPGDFVQRAEDAIQNGGYLTAFRLLENVAVSGDAAAVDRARQLLARDAQLQVIAKSTFMPGPVADTLRVHGAERGIKIEQDRLAAFRVIASHEVYEEAARNLESSVNLVSANRKQQEEQRADAERRKARVRAEMIAAAERARFVCRGDDECRKAFALAQVFVSDNADMKIQVATDTIVETYNATEPLRVALKVVKIPGSGTVSTLVLSGTCKSEARDTEQCDVKMLKIYGSFPETIRSALRP
jgi:hypothetical protein